MASRLSSRNTAGKENLEGYLIFTKGFLMHKNDANCRAQAKAAEMAEAAMMVERYRKRNERGIVKDHLKNFEYNYEVKCEREIAYCRLLRSRFESLRAIRLLEIGAGDGDNILGFLRMGMQAENIAANELLDYRREIIQARLPHIRIIPGDALRIDINEEYDVVFQSLVFTSILNSEVRKTLALKMWSWLRKGGCILWYDFVYNNPTNPDVRKVGLRELHALFPRASCFRKRRVTVAPPIGRRLSNVYGIINRFAPWLRTHIVARIDRDE